ncbi:alpha/beta fold hydrolase [Pseudomonas saxonica]|uniref:Alpha/beta fold hydrolase n=1 Tax=Pseudomonas saxonica TaxID=2600598 RepID=A0ABY3GLC1_9PSED|nr:alpha/beta fold hydrolase [Pseudomonas saxonica]TWR92501.1 alpha/beta fold hydrolase [Pseudomonas saxonica]
MINVPDLDLRASDIAITAMAGEFPRASTPDNLWALLFEKAFVSTPFSLTQRWPDDESTGYSRHAAFIENAHGFDPGFFSMAPVQALYSDPQERRLLQTTYHALENSGYFQDPHGDVGVYTAAMYSHYQNLGENTSAFSTSFAQIANRISHRLDLTGPSLCVDTMCSGSLVALHLAATALRQGECRMAVVGAANIHSCSGKFRLLCEGGYLSRTGRCHTFGALADGYMAGEGSIAVVIKTVAQAQADGDPILGVIRASAVGSDGGAGAFTVPDANAQARVMRTALERAAINASQISYVECHGTGTPVGDPVEIASLAQVYSGSDRPLLPIGSIKGNIGHLEAAAGLAGLVKVLLQLQHQMLLPNVGAHPANPKLNLPQANLEIVSTPQSWQGQRLAAINSFGAGGTNAHVILQSAPPLPMPDEVKGAHQWMLPVSAHTTASLKKRLAQLIEWIDTHPSLSLYALGYTLSCARQHHRFRVCVQARDLSEARSALVKALDGPFDDSRQPSITSKNRALTPAQAYLQGDVVGWTQLYPVRSLTALPPFPFANRHFDALNGPLRQPAPAPTSSTPSQVAPLVTPSDSLLSWEHLQGDGPTVLLLTPTNVSKRAWHCQTAFLQRNGFNLLIPSYPGHDGNSMPDQDFSLTDIADAIALYLKHHATTPVHCVGWSLGASIALHLAIDHSSVLDKLCLISGSARFMHSIPHMLGAFRDEIEQWDEFISLQLDTRQDARLALLAGANKEAMNRYYLLLRDYNVQPRLAELSTCTLVIHGIDDHCITPQERDLLGNHERCSLRQLPGGHLLPITASRAINTLLLEHFS